MKSFYRLSNLIFLSFLTAGFLIGQPVNDLCSGAINIVPAESESLAVWIPGTTIGTADGLSQIGPTVCSANFYRDDVWYAFVIPSNSELDQFVVHAKLGTISAIGMALYPMSSCNSLVEPILCENYPLGSEAIFQINQSCLGNIGDTIILRLWSAEGSSISWQDGQGSFSVGVYFNNDPNFLTCLWGDKVGEGDFGGSLNTWNSESANCVTELPWKWVVKFDLHGGFEGIPFVSAPTSCNGMAVFDSDLLDGTGTCPTPQHGILTSPVIDLSNTNNPYGVAVEFYQGLRNYSSQFFVDYSQDGGITWDSIKINTILDDPYLYGTNGPHVANNQKYLLPGVNNPSQLVVRFRMVGNYYYWIIDDVKIKSVKAPDISIGKGVACAPYKLWQKDNLYPMGGAAYVSNKLGSKTSDFMLHFEVTNPDNSVIFHDSLFVNGLNKKTIDTLIILPNNFQPSEILGSYKGNYWISPIGIDLDLTNNSASIDWQVVDDLYAKESLNDLSGGFSPSADKNYTIGNVFWIVNNNQHLDVKFVDVGVSNASSLADVAGITVFVDKWVDQNSDKLPSEDEKTRIGFSSYDFTSLDVDKSVFSLPLLDFNILEEGITLEPNNYYIVSVEYNSPAAEPDLFFFVSTDNSQNFNYNALIKRTHALPNIANEYGTVLSIGNSANWNIVTPNSIPYIRFSQVDNSNSNKNGIVYGSTYFDTNCNGIKDTLEKGLPNITIYSKDLNPVTHSKINGKYSGTVNLGLNKVVPLEIYGAMVSPPFYEFYSDLDGTDFGPFDFNYCKTSSKFDLEVSLIEYGPPRPGFPNYYQVHVKNKSFEPASGQVIVDFIDNDASNSIVELTSNVGMVNGKTLTFDSGDLDFFESTSVFAEIELAPNALLGSKLMPRARIIPDAGVIDEFPANNEDILDQTVVGSYDPNDKNVNRTGLTAQELNDGVELEYTIRFQNTGTYPATFVILRDTLQPELDIKTFRMIAASHDYDLSFPGGNQLKWLFSAINLPDSTSNEPESHGFVKFSIKTLLGLDVFDIVSNNAAIYFDFNLPVITNTITSQYVVSTVEISKKKALDIVVFPNPVRESISYKFTLPKSADVQYSIQDVSGKNVMKWKEKVSGLGDQLTVKRVSELPNGVYWLSIETNEQKGTVQFVKQ